MQNTKTILSLSLHFPLQLDNMSQDTTNSFSKMSLNPSASEWKPNFGAKAFVPSFGAPAAAAAAPAAAPVAPAAAAPGKLSHHSKPLDQESRDWLRSFCSSC